MKYRIKSMAVMALLALVFSAGGLFADPTPQIVSLGHFSYDRYYSDDIHEYKTTIWNAAGDEDGGISLRGSFNVVYPTGGNGDLSFEFINTYNYVDGVRNLTNTLEHGTFQAGGGWTNTFLTDWPESYPGIEEYDTWEISAFDHVPIGGGLWSWPMIFQKGDVISPDQIGICAGFDATWFHDRHSNSKIVLKLNGGEDRDYWVQITFNFTSANPPCPTIAGGPNMTAVPAVSDLGGWAIFSIGGQTMLYNEDGTVVLKCRGNGGTTDITPSYTGGGSYWFRWTIPSVVVLPGDPHTIRFGQSTNAPYATSEPDGSIHFRESDGTDALIRVQDVLASGAVASSTLVASNSAANPGIIQSGTANAEVLTVTSGNDYTAGHGPALIFRHANTTTGEKLARIKGAFTYSNDGNYGDMIFATRLSDAAGLTDKLWIKNDGKVGIGTGDPTQTLTVAGTLGVTGVAKVLSMGGSGSGGLFGYNDTQGAGSQIWSLTRQDELGAGGTSFSSYGGIGLTAGRNVYGPATNNFDVSINADHSVSVANDLDVGGSLTAASITTSGTGSINAGGNVNALSVFANSATISGSVSADTLGATTTSSRFVDSESIVSATYKVGTSSGPTITQGSGTPTSSAPDGSLYLKTGSGGGLYVRVNGAWVAK